MFLLANFVIKVRCSEHDKMQCASQRLRVDRKKKERTKGDRSELGNGHLGDLG